MSANFWVRPVISNPLYVSPIFLVLYMIIGLAKSLFTEYLSCVLVPLGGGGDHLRLEQHLRLYQECHAWPIKFGLKSYCSFCYRYQENTQSVHFSFRQFFLETSTVYVYNIPSTFVDMKPFESSEISEGFGLNTQKSEFPSKIKKIIDHHQGGHVITKPRNYEVS